jgi:HTH-type transcriptional regulator / antitoxin HigA
MTEILRPFAPDWVTPPGGTIEDILEERDWTQAQLAERLGYSTKHVSQLINGKAPITEETALKLEKVLGSTARFWLEREAQYRARLAQIAEQENLKSWVPWLDELPVRELMQQGAISKCRADAKNKPGIVRDLLQFFGVASPEEWRSYYAGMEGDFRRTRQEQSDTGAILSWLRLGELEAERQDSPKYNATKFRKAVDEIRTFTVEPPEVFQPKMERLCGDAGVIFAMVPAIPCAHICGIARWVNPHRALIQLSLYGKTNDRFWFTFFHESAHILLHTQEKNAIFLDAFEGGSTIESEKEKEADRWACEFLIPPEYEQDLPHLTHKEQVIEFAGQLGIHPGIVVGRLQHESILECCHMNDLKEKFCF